MAQQKGIVALKFKHQTKAEIPAELHPLYVEREGAWILDVEGAVEKSKLDEFRTIAPRFRKSAMN